LSRRVPKRVIADAKAAYAGLVPDILAPLHSDSLVDEGDGPAQHQLRFRYEDQHFAVTVRRTGDYSTLSGVGPGAIEALLSARGTVKRLHGTPDGAFLIGPIPRGIVRLSFAKGGRKIYTDWFQI
jgi:hypothetical protein